MFKWRLTIPMALALALAGGCSTNGKKEPTQHEAAKQQWNNARAAVLYSLGKQQYEGGNFDDCRKSLDDALKMAPDNVASHLLMAKVGIEQGKLDQSLHELETVRQLAPGNADADYLAGVIYQRWQRPDTALGYYVAACNKSPNELSYLLARAEMLVALDRSDEAMELLHSKLTYFENSPAIRDAVGQLLVRKAKYREAAAVLRQASILSADDQGIREHLALALYYDKQYREAGQLFERLLKDDRYQSRADLQTALGECQMQTERLHDARDSFQVAAQLEPADPIHWLNLAKVAMELNDLTRAEMSVRKALSLEPARSECHLMLGYLRLRQQKLNEALSAFGKASLLDDKDPVSLCMIGVVLEKQGKSSEAIACYGKALKLRPNDELAATLMAQVRVQD